MTPAVRRFKMTHTDLLKQTVQSGRSAFETSFNAAQSLQNQAEKMVCVKICLFSMVSPFLCINLDSLVKSLISRFVVIPAKEAVSEY